MKYSLIDTHCDTASEALDKGVGFCGGGLHVDLDKMRGVRYTQFFAAYIAPQYSGTAFGRACAIINKVKSEAERSCGRMALCKSFEDYEKNASKVRAFLSLEGGEAIEDIDALGKLYDEGVRFAALTWNFSNRIASGVLEPDEKRGLTDFGRDVVSEMNRLGMIIDVSHLNDKSFWDIIEESKKPVIASHSNARAVCKNKRNLTDEQFFAIKEKGGFVGINFYPAFLSDKPGAGIDDVIRHIDHFLSLGGEDNIGIGADFDGVDCLPRGVTGVHDVCRVFDEMLRRGYGEELVNKISYTNMERILKENL